MKHDYSSLSGAEQQVLLEQLLPHRSPMLLLDRVLGTAEDGARAEVVVTGQSAFFQPGLDGVPAWVGLEYMAQTVAVWSGQQLLDHGRPVAIGFLLGSRAYRADTPLFTRDTRLTIDIHVAYAEPGGLSSFDCVIRAGNSRKTATENGKVLAEARINAFRPDDPLPYMQEGLKLLKGGKQ